MFTASTEADIGKATDDIVKTLKGMEVSWTHAQNKKIKEKIMENLQKKKRSNEYSGVILAKCKDHGGPFANLAELTKAVKEHFGAKNDQANHDFRTFTEFQRTQLRQYVNGEIELSEMKDPEVPTE